MGVPSMEQVQVWTEPTGYSVRLEREVGRQLAGYRSESRDDADSKQMSDFGQMGRKELIRLRRAKEAS